MALRKQSNQKKTTLMRVFVVVFCILVTFFRPECIQLNRVFATEISESEMKAREVSQRKVTVEFIEDKSNELNQDKKEHDELGLHELLNKARRLYLERNYEMCEKLCRTILSNWSDNENAIVILKKSILKQDQLLFEEILHKNDEKWKNFIKKIRRQVESFKQEEEILHGFKEEKPKWMIQMTQKLNTKITLSITNKNLYEIMQIISEQIGIDFKIDPNLDIEELVVKELRMGKISAKSAINMILNGLPAHSPLIYQFRIGSIFITTEEEAQKAFIRPKGVLYDVSDLVSTFFKDLFNSNTFKILDKVEDRERLSIYVMVKIIREVIESKSWDTNDVSINMHGAGQIMVSQTVEVHNKIQELLKILRRNQ